MATYTVNISGTLNSNYAYATLAGTKTTTAGTKTYTSKPTIAVYVSSSNSSARSNCKVTLNGATVKNGYGSYTVDIGDADIVSITFTSVRSGYYTYYTCDITTETSAPPDPMAPHDGHNTNIGNVAREIERATALIGGVVRKIENGLALVNGVSREIAFAPDIDPVLGNNTPEQIQAIAQSGQAANFWSVGDKIGIALSGNVGALSLSDTYYAFILGFDHNSGVEGSNSIHFQFGKTNAGVDIAFCDSNYNNNGSSAGFRINTSSTNSGAWNGSYMRKTICPAFLSVMPTAWQNVIAACTKYSDNTGGGSNTASYVTTTSDKIWLLSEFEVQGKRTNANSAEQNYQKQYDYYKNGNSKVKYKHNATTTACIWWLRSVFSSYTYGFCCVGTGGNAVENNANASFGFAPGFKVA